MSVPSLAEALERILRIGPSEALREDERAMGFEPMKPGDVSWFSADDWSEGDIVSICGNEVRIVALKATRPGTGALSRLVTSIIRSGRHPIIVEPLFFMPEILKRWGWRSRIVGSGIQRHEVWEPTVEWLEHRRTEGAA